MPDSVPQLAHAAFGRAFVDELQRRGLGAMSKRELEALVLHLLESHSGLRILSNHDAGLLFRAPASRMKALRHEAALRFADDIGALATERLREAIKTGRYETDTDRVVLVIEDSLGRDAVLAAFKVHGGYGDWTGGNSEVIRAKSPLVTKVLKETLPNGDIETFVDAVNKGKEGPARKAFVAIMRTVFDDIKSRGAGKLIDLASDSVGKHLVDLAKLAPLATQIINAIGS